MSYMLRRKVKSTNLARLIALNPPDPRSREFVLAKHQLSIGSDDQNDIVVRDTTVSRRHALLTRRRGNGWQITDLGSTNGTTVNGARIKAATEIRFGDEIAIGGVSLALVAASGVAGAAAGRLKPARQRIASLRTVIEVGLIFFVVGFGAAQYLAFLKYREENRFLLAQAEEIPADQLAERARLTSRQIAPVPSSASTPAANSSTTSAPPVIASLPPTATESASKNPAVLPGRSSAVARTLSIPSVLTPANRLPTMASSGDSGAETTVAVTLAQ
jgi:pSer/pThr/pTyr-binding forkhead associated (FHA) protein